MSNPIRRSKLDSVIFHTSL
ncbi:hypothetical protein Taro_050705 [Colocasia esculenta]|uniref:Uncharacterized protein n=1 Tax=Colocasia esculenta TaxID=4460 RepID=A0A843XER2_COLES|nr:hypothetical protein [Colocasia esculenta]